MQEFDTYCPAPWHSGFYTFTEQSVCCAHAAQKGTSVIEFLNSDHVRTVKQNLINGTPDEFCQRCFDVERAGGKSMRQCYADNKALRGPSNRDPEAATVPEQIEIRLGNLCNYKCRICAPKWSSSIDREVSDNPELKKYFHSQELDMGRQYANQKFVEEIVSLMPNVKWLNFTGGEPMIIPELLPIIDSAVQGGFSKDMNLQITTNGSAINPKLLEAFGHFRGVQLTISIDGVGKYAEYIRHGTVWTKFEQNFNQYMSLIRNNPTTIGCNPNIALSAYSVFNLDLVLEFLLPYWNEYLITFDAVLVEDNTSAWHLAGSARAKAIDSLYRAWNVLSQNPPRENDFKRSSGGYPQDLTRLKNQIWSLREQLINQQPDPEKSATLRSLTADLDRVRGENFRQLFGFDL